MRIAMVIAVGVLATGCKKKEDANTGEPPEPTRPPIVHADSADAAVAAPTPAPPPVAAEAPLDPKKPVEVKRTHTIGQRYAITMTHTGLVKEVYDAEATVTDVKDGGFQNAVLIKSLTVDGALRGKDAALEIWVRPHDSSGSVDAEQLAGADLSMYLTPLEIMLGDGGWPPSGAHTVGEKWKDHGDDWVLVGIEAKDGINYAHYTTKEVYKDGGGQSSDLRLAVRDGYLGHVTLTQTLAIAGKNKSQVYEIDVKPLAPTTAN